MMLNSRSSWRLSATAATLLALTACGGGPKPATDTKYVALDVTTLYNAAQDRLERKQYAEAAALFDETERQHPYTEWARRAQLKSAFSYYAAKDYTKGIDSARRFISTHPGNEDAPYAYYLVAMSYYEQISDVRRDQKTTDEARTALTELVRRYPQSPYADDARLKLDLVSDHLAGKEMEVGRFYERRRRWLPRPSGSKRSSTTTRPPAMCPRRSIAWSRPTCPWACRRRRRSRPPCWGPITRTASGIRRPTT